jgi:threonine aldolase
MMARLLFEKTSQIPGITITQKVQANAVFAIIPKSIIGPLKEKYFFYVWDEATSEVRWMTSFDTTPEDIEGFSAFLTSKLL